MPEKLLNIQTDFVFKRVFGAAENKNVLISFLNAVWRDPLHIEVIFAYSKSHCVGNAVF